jgi:hypothetical protein
MVYPITCVIPKLSSAEKLGRIAGVLNFALFPGTISPFHPIF